MNFSLQPIRNFETKCGPASHVLLKDVTRLSPCDMLVADTRGAVVLFCDGQILVRKCSLSGKTSRVTALEVQETGCEWNKFNLASINLKNYLTYCIGGERCFIFLMFENSV